MLERILDEDFTLVLSTAPEQPVGRQAWLDLAFNGYVCQRFAYSHMAVRILGDTAVVSSLYDQRASVRGIDRSGQFFLVDVWQRREGSWKVVCRYSSKPEGGSTSADSVVTK